MPTKTKTEDEIRFEKALIAETASLRRFALGRTRDAAAADDLVQDTLLLALRNRKRFKMGTNLKAWLFTILKNAHLNQIRKQRVSYEYNDDLGDGLMWSAPSQESHMELQDANRALQALPATQRDTLMYHTFQSANYAETAQYCKCSHGTIKSRLSRARASLSEHLNQPAAVAFDQAA